MKKKIYIKWFKKEKSESELNIDQVLNHYNLDFKNLDFTTQHTDPIKSLHTINKKLKSDPSFLRNLKTILPFINYKAILKPIYTIVLTSIVLITIFELNKTKNPVQYAEIFVDRGEKITVHVTENFTIYLNAESSIKIPLELKQNAKIYLDGEAYFEINQNKTTTVVANGIIFESKNCNFHINSKDKKRLIAHVKEGNLDFYNPDLPKSTKLHLSNNDKAVYNPAANFIAVEKEKNINYLAWHTGKMEFKDTPLYSVTNNLSEFFGIPIEIENKVLSKQKISAQFINVEIDDILDKLQTQFNCQISADGNKIVIN